MIGCGGCFGDRDPERGGVRRGFDGNQTRHGGGSKGKTGEMKMEVDLKRV